MNQLMTLMMWSCDMGTTWSCYGQMTWSRVVINVVITLWSHDHVMVRWRDHMLSNVVITYYDHMIMIIWLWLHDMITCYDQMYIWSDVHIAYAVIRYNQKLTSSVLISVNKWSIYHLVLILRDTLCSLLSIKYKLETPPPFSSVNGCEVCTM